MLPRATTERAGARFEFDDPAEHVVAAALDREAGRLEQADGVLVEPAAPGQAPPGGRGQALQAARRLPGVVHVFEHEEAPAGPQHAAHLGKGGGRVGHAAPGERRDGAVERPVRKRQLLGVRADHGHDDRRRVWATGRSPRRSGALPGRGARSVPVARCSAQRHGAYARPRGHHDRGFDRRDLRAGRVKGKARAGARADLEHARTAGDGIGASHAGTGGGAGGAVQAPPPAPHEQLLGGPHDGVVDPGVELAVAHRRVCGPFGGARTGLRREQGFHGRLLYLPRNGGARDKFAHASN